MTKQEFLKRLGDLLACLPADQVREAQAFYAEAIDDRMEEGASEEEAVACLGTPKEAAQETKAVVKDTTLLALAPLSVLPDYQNKGIGLALMKAGHAIARKLGYEYSVVLGYPQYYSKVGYIPASKLGIEAPFEVEDEYFMALSLNGNQAK